MEFSLVPSFEFTDLHQVHPYILYLEVKGDRPNLWKYRSDLTNSAAWKVVLILLNDTIFAIDNETGAKIEVGNLENGDQISMGGRHLRFVVVKPYAHSEKEQTPHIETLIRNKVAAMLQTRRNNQTSMPRTSLPSSVILQRKEIDVASKFACINKTSCQARGHS